MFAYLENTNSLHIDQLGACRRLTLVHPWFGTLIHPPHWNPLVFFQWELAGPNIQTLPETNNKFAPKKRMELEDDLFFLLGRVRPFFRGKLAGIVSGSVLLLRLKKRHLVSERFSVSLLNLFFLDSPTWVSASHCRGSLNQWDFQAIMGPLTHTIPLP